MRLDRFLSMRGIDSRKSIKKVIRDGRVQVDGKTVYDFAMSIDGNSVVVMDGVQIQNEPYVTLMMNKPEGYMCSMKDERYPSLHLLQDRQDPDGHPSCRCRRPHRRHDLRPHLGSCLSCRRCLVHSCQLPRG